MSIRQVTDTLKTPKVNIMREERENRAKIMFMKNHGWKFTKSDKMFKHTQESHMDSKLHMAP